MKIGIPGAWPIVTVGDIKQIFRRMAGQHDCLILADSRYLCLFHVMTPYPDPERGPQSCYNLAHCRTRARVEIIIGILKASIVTIRGEQHPPIPQIAAEEKHHLHAAAHRDGMGSLYVKETKENG
ncbi:hypothetical protein P4O66_004183 [Electrophorus voltai]|uniref:DDE Tnp4 domain-containing protein n=1 Tax=Electrophorus voltai TaxID=2609070 RepID=A0AAD9E2F1_9TELE|nr:hypothetical protein P4O66_004183 [Electrophorus voltai]